MAFGDSDLIDAAVEELLARGLLAVRFEHPRGFDVVLARRADAGGRVFESESEIVFFELGIGKTPVLRLGVFADSIMVARMDGYGGPRPEDFCSEFATMDAALEFILEYLCGQDELGGAYVFG